MNGQRLVIFDLDGTLIDTVALVVGAFSFAFEQTGLAVPDENSIRATSGLSTNIAMQRLAPKADDDVIEKLLAIYRNEYIARAALTTREPLFPGALAALDRLNRRDDVVMAVATGKPMRGVNRVMQTHDLRGFFTSLQTPDDNISKPHPDMIDSAMAVVGAKRHQTVMIGDTSHDMEMAVNAGVKAIGVDWGYHEVETLENSGADIVVSDFALLLAAIDRMTEV